jgi:hypothetical protein
MKVKINENIIYWQLCLRVGDGDFDLYTWLDIDGGDLLHDLGGRVQVNDPLVDAHLEPVPGLGAFTARGLARRDAQDFGRHAHGALHQINN